MNATLAVTVVLCVSFWLVGRRRRRKVVDPVVTLQSSRRRKGAGPPLYCMCHGWPRGGQEDRRERNHRRHPERLSYWTGPPQVKEEAG